MKILWLIIMVVVALLLSSHGLIRTVVKWKQDGVLECSTPYCKRTDTPTLLDMIEVQGKETELLFV